MATLLMVSPIRHRNPLRGRSKLEMAAKAVPTLTNYATKTGGKDVASLLAAVLK